MNTPAAKWSDTLAAMTGQPLAEGQVAAIEEELDRLLGMPVAGRDIAEALRWLADRDQIQPRVTPSAATIASAIRALRSPRSGSSAPADGIDIGEYTRRLDAIAAGRPGCNRDLWRRRNPQSACRECDRLAEDQAWCVICEPANTKTCAAVKAYADRIGLAYRRPDGIDAGRLAAWKAPRSLATGRTGGRTCADMGDGGSWQGGEADT